MQTPASAPTLGLRFYSALARWALRLTVAVWLVVGLTWGVLYGVIVPRINHWREDIELALVQRLGIGIRLGPIETVSHGDGWSLPTLRLHDVMIHPPGSDAPGLRIGTLHIAVSTPSLLGLGFDQLVMDDVDLRIQRHADGHITVGGLPLQWPPQSPQDNALTDWLFSQREWVVRRANITWQDDTRPEAPPLALTDLNAVLRNGARHHDWQLSATPPEGWGQPFSVQGKHTRGVLSRSASRFEDWRGTLFAHFPQVDLTRWQAHLPAGTLGRLGDLQVQQGQGALRLWLDSPAAQQHRLTSDMALADVQLHSRRAGAPEPLRLLNLHGRMRWQWQVLNQVPTVTFDTDALSVTLPQHPPLRLGAVHATYAAQADEAQDATLTLSDWSLDTVRTLTEHWPLPTEWRATLSDWQPRGEVTELQARWRHTPTDATPDWGVQATLKNLSVRPGQAPARDVPGRPGVERATLRLKATPAGGDAQMHIEQGQLTFPGVFDEPQVPVNRFLADIAWTQGPHGWQLAMPQLQWHNADMSGSASLTWRPSDPRTSPSKDTLPGVLALQGRLSQARAERVWRYLPTGLSADVRGYLQQAVRKGHAKDVSFRVEGDLWDFPYGSHGKGVFAVQAPLTDVTLDVAPGAGPLPWPPFQNLSGLLVFDNDSLRIDNAQTQAMGHPSLSARQVNARLDRYTGEHPELVVQGRVDGPLPAALAYVRQSPLHGLTGGALADMVTQGPTSVDLGLRIPLNRPETTQVNATVRLPNNRLQLHPEAPELTQVRADVRVTETSVQVENATAHALGGALRFGLKGGPTAKGWDIVAQGSGQATVQAMATYPALSSLHPLWGSLRGASPYDVRLNIGRQGVEWAVNTSLTGIQAALPAPLTKPADAAWPLLVSLQSTGGSPGQGMLNVSLQTGAAAPPLVARYVIPNGRSALRGQLHWAPDAPGPLPAQGVHAKLRLNQLDAEAWRQWLSNADSGPDPTAQPTPPPSASTRYAPTRIDLTVDRWLHPALNLTGLTVHAEQQGTRWQAQLAAEQMKGTLTWLPAHTTGPGQSAKLVAKLDHLTLPKAARPASTLQATPLTNDVHWPMLDVDVTQFTLGDKPLGRLSLQATPNAQRWAIDSLRLVNPDAVFNANGAWALNPNRPGEPARMQLDYALDIRNAGQLLARWGMAGVVAGGSGTLNGQLGWQGTPTHVHYPSLDGWVRLNLGQGQFLKSDPGIARLLGVLSLQSLPRRLAFDFKDVFSQGFRFDRIEGDARIAQGVMSTQNLQMRGVNAQVFMEGSTQLADETQAIKVLVVPELNAGTASLLAATVNPLAGLSSLIAQYVLREPLQAVTSQYIHVTGTWTEPVVEKVDRPTPVPLQ